MDEAIQFWRSLQGYLRVSHEVVSKVGEIINKGEKFTVRLTVANTAPSPGITSPLIRFKNIRVLIGGTKYAQPSTYFYAFESFPVPLGLNPGYSTHVDVEMKAKDNFPSDWVPEPIADLRIWAQFDQDAYFGVHIRTQIMEDIRPPATIQE